MREGRSYPSALGGTGERPAIPVVYPTAFKAMGRDTLSPVPPTELGTDAPSPLSRAFGITTNRAHGPAIAQ